MNKNNHIRIKNPISKHHLVKVLPGQTIQIQLENNFFPDHKINLIPQSSLFFLQKTQNENFCEYIIGHEDFFHSWAKHSSAHVGEIWINSKKQSARLIVVLESVNELKSNFITVVNPDYIDLRITPGDIIEVVLFDNHADQKYDWSWEFTPDTESDVELIAESIFEHEPKNKTVEDCPDFTFSRCQRTKTECAQYHFWFRFDKKLLSLMDHITGVNSLGNFSFIGTPKNKKDNFNCIEKYLSVQTNFNKKNKMRVLHSLLLTKDNNSHFLIKKTIFKNKNFDRKKEHFVRDINVKLIDTKCLEKHCNTAPQKFDQKNTDSKKISQYFDVL